MVAQTRYHRVLSGLASFRFLEGTYKFRTGLASVERILLTHLCCRSYRACRADAIPILVTTEGRRWSGR